jgi:hypothetical protein
LYDRYGSFEHAEEAFSSVIKMDPKFEKANEIYFRLGLIYKQQGKRDLSLQVSRIGICLFLILLLLLLLFTSALLFVFAQRFVDTNIS